MTGTEKRVHLGLVINPWAGIGGAVALKGSDGAQVREAALQRGAEPKAQERVRVALQSLLPLRDRLMFHTAAGNMGADLLNEMGFAHAVHYYAERADTTAADTEAAVAALHGPAPGMLLFAGGDGTARNVAHVLGDAMPVLGIPAGVKIHSAVYAVSPQAAGELLRRMLSGEVLELTEARVMDLDENAYRAGQVKAKVFGYMRVPADPLVQQSKDSARASEEGVCDDIAARVVADMEADVLQVIGSGSTCMHIKQALGIAGSLLGVDVLRNGELLCADATEQQLLDLLGQYPDARLYVTVIGGQGHVFGRGNQQLSARVLRKIGRDNIRVVASPGKLQWLAGRPLLIDSGDAALDAAFAGPIRVITGYSGEALAMLQ